VPGGAEVRPLLFLFPWHGRPFEAIEGIERTRFDVRRDGRHRDRG
jgi:hypothetical protein